jgi:hypothetical protein
VLDALSSTCIRCGEATLSRPAKSGIFKRALILWQISYFVSVRTVKHHMHVHSNPNFTFDRRQKKQQSV